MNTVLQIIFEFVLAFTAMDYALVRFTVNERISLVVSIIFAVLFVIFAHLTLPGLA